MPLRSPVEVYLAPRVDALPPEPPRDAGVLAIMSWSLQLRFWAWRNDSYSGPKAHARMFVKYFAPAPNLSLAHSIGLREGLTGVVNAFASDEMAGGNQVVIAHELLHTFGATDKYHPVTNQPLFPDGYAEPNANPPLPQSKAEIMAGRIPIEQTRAVMPRGLEDTVIGAKSARNQLAEVKETKARAGSRRLSRASARIWRSRSAEPYRSARRDRTPTAESQPDPFPW